MKMKTLVSTLLIVAVCTIVSGCTSLAQQGQNINARDRNLGQRASDSRYSAGESSDNLQAEGGTDRASLIGFIKESGSPGTVLFRPLGSDGWISIPMRLIKRRDPVESVMLDGRSHEQVRLRLAGQQQEVQRLFGLMGWNEIRDYTTLVGVVQTTDYSGGIGGDGDWLLKIKPDPAYERLLINRAGRRNEGGLIECEVEPPDAVGDEDNQKAYFGRLKGKRVTVVGTFVEDKSHDNKTEIHPITSITCADGEFVHILVVSDDSDNFPANVPHSEENRTAHISIPLAAGLTTFSVAEEKDRARSKSIGVVSSASGNHLVATIQSGTPDEGRGFYYARVKPERCPPHGCEQPVPPHGRYLAVQFFDGVGESGGWLFLQKDNTTFKERQLAPGLSAADIARIAASLADELGMRYVLNGTTIKLYAPDPWPVIKCSHPNFNFWDGQD